MSISHSTSAPVRPRSTFVTALLLLLAVTSLAALLSARRTSIVLGDRITNSGWSISFRAPSGWLPIRLPAFRRGNEFVFAPPGNVDGGPLLIVEEIDNRQRRSPADIAEAIRIRRGYPGFAGLFAQPPARRYPAQFGPFPGLRMEDDARGIIVAVGTDRDRAFSVQLLSGNDYISPRDRQLLAAVVDSVEPM